MSSQFDVVIAGAGLTGLTLAALLSASSRQDKLRLRVVDGGPRPAHRADAEIALRVSALSLGSVSLLDEIGAWQAVRGSRVCAYDRMRVWDGSTGPDSKSTLRFDAAEFAVAELGFIVENMLVRQALLDVLETGNAELIFDARIEKLQRENHSTHILLEDGRELQAGLLVGADGAHSFVRNSLGIDSHEWPYGQSAFVSHVQPALPHRNTAWQRFLTDGPLGLLPLPDGRVSVVWSTTDARVEAAMQASDAELGRMLSAASDRVLGELQASGPRAAFPLCARHAQEYVQPGVALIGDAAHSIHPLAGQGANLGLQDAQELAAVLDAALCNGEHPGDRPVLRRYERSRKGANATMLHFMTGLNRLFTTDFAGIPAIRKAGMQLFNHSGPVRERIVGRALGTDR